MELYINNQLVDLNERIPFPLTFQISDIREIENRKGNSSKTITLPGTSRNTRLMANTFTLTTTDNLDESLDFDSFDPSVKASARYYEKGILQFQGVCQLTDCEETDGIWSFNVVLFSDQMDYFNLLKNYKLKELGWGEYNHTLTYTNQQNSWQGVIQKNGVNYSNQSASAWIGEGYYYGLIDYGYDRPAPNAFEVIHIAPQIFAKSIVDKMFNAIGVTYDSDFFTSQRFKQILLAWEGGNLPTIDTAEATALSVESDQVNGAGGSVVDMDYYPTNTVLTNQHFNGVPVFIPINVDSGTLVDPTSQVQNDTPFRFISSADGTINVVYSGQHDITYTINSTGAGSVDTNILSTGFLEIYKNGAQYQVHQLWTDNQSTTGSTINVSETFSLTAPIVVNSSDEITFKLVVAKQTYITTDNDNPYVNMDMSLTGVELDLEYQEQGILAGATINIAQFLPDMDCATFLKGLVTAFNLYIQPTVDDPKTVKIEPLNEFYNGSNNAVNWSKYVDRSRTKKVTPSINFTTSKYNFTFEDDKDYWNERYFQDVTTQYGSKILTSASQFATGETNFKLPFANKLLGQIPETDLIVPRNFTGKTVAEGVTEITPKKGKAFLVQIKKGNVFTQSMQTADWIHIDETDTANAETEYPYVGHLDSIDSPTFDLMFNIPSYVFYDIPAGINYTTNNLYGYHEKYIKELLNKHGKLLTCYINLDARLINTLDFRNLINIDGVVYRLNKVDNYDSSNNASTKCEFIKIIEGESAQTYTIETESDPYEEPSKGRARVTESGEERQTEDAEKRIIE